MVQHDWSATVFHQLDTKLPDEGHHVVQDVHVVERVGGTHFVTVCSAVPHDDVAARVEEAIHTIVGNALPGRRHVVRIVWADPG